MAGKHIVLITDFGASSPFPGIMKGVIRNISRGAEIIDLSHQIPPYRIEEAAFLLMCSYRYFPEKTLFVAVVDPGVGGERKIVLVETKKYYFLAPDNGILSWVLEREKAKNIIAVNNQKYFLEPVGNTFQGRDIFAPVAARLVEGKKIEHFGTKIDRIKKISFPEVEKRGDKFIGKILYLDHFGNLITNFAAEDFAGKLKRDFILKLKNKILDEIKTSYSRVKKNEPLLIWGSFGFLEIALCEGNLARKWRVKPGDKVILQAGD